MLIHPNQDGHASISKTPHVLLSTSETQNSLPGLPLPFGVARGAWLRHISCTAETEATHTHMQELYLITAGKGTGI